MGERLKVIKLLEPSICLNCRFCSPAIAEMADGSKHNLIYCNRLDCDNWDYSSVEIPVRVEVEVQREDF